MSPKRPIFILDITKISQEEVSDNLSVAFSNKFDFKSVAGPILFQIVMFENVSRSVTSQIEELEALLNPQQVSVDRLRSSKLVRDVNMDADDQNLVQSPTQDLFKLTLQDSHGNLCFAMEREKLAIFSNKRNGIIPQSLGSKLIVKKGCSVINGVILLDNAHVENIGGSIPEWNKELNLKILTFLRDKLSQKKLP